VSTDAFDPLAPGPEDEQWYRDHGCQDAEPGEEPFTHPDLDNEAARVEWIAEAEQFARTQFLPLERVPHDHPARAWDAQQIEQVELLGPVLVKAVRSRATAAIASAKKALDVFGARRAEEWRKRLGQVERGSAWGSPTPDRWLEIARMVEAGSTWLPLGGLGEQQQKALDDLLSIDTERREALDRAAAEALDEAIEAEKARRSADDAWEEELQRRERRADNEPSATQDGDEKGEVSGAPRIDRWGSPKRPVTGARAVQTRLFKPIGEQITLRHWREEWLEYTGTHWTTRTGQAIEARLYEWLEHATYWVPAKTAEGEPTRFVPRDWNPNRSNIGDLLKALAAFSHTDDKSNMPVWLDGSSPGPAVALRNGVLLLETRRVLPHTPAFFTPYSLPFEYDPRAQCPKWLPYLRSILDEASISLLQEWTGYMISGRTDLQKLLFLVGPKRSGKGTYAYMLTQLLGEENVVGPTMGGFIERFGLQSFIGKPLAIFDDVRVPPRSDTLTVAVERLLSITGEGGLDVDRKNKAPWSGRLPTRIMMMSNEIAEFPDPSGALPYRTLAVVYNQSFAGREDHQLKQKLIPDLPGMLNWGLDGLDRLNQNNGQFTMPASGAEAREEIADAANPVRPFTREFCDLGADYSVCVDKLYALWAQQHGGYKDEEAQKRRFGKLLKQAHPEIRKDRPMVDGIREYRYFGIRIKSGMPGNFGGGE